MSRELVKLSVNLATQLRCQSREGSPVQTHWRRMFPMETAVSHPMRTILPLPPRLGPDGRSERTDVFLAASAALSSPETGLESLLDRVEGGR